MKTAILFIKRDSYRKMKSLTTEYIREGMSGNDLMYRAILIKYQEFTKYGSFILKLSFMTSFN